MEYVSPRRLQHPTRSADIVTFLRNSALYEDACLYLVPKSHKVPRTDGQRAHSTTLEPPADPLAMPGAIRPVLQR